MSGFTPKIFAGPAPAQLRAGFHFIKNQQRAILRADFAQAFQKARLRHADADIHHDRFQDDRGDLPRKLLEAMFHAGQIVEGRDSHVIEHRLDHAQVRPERNSAR